MTLSTILLNVLRQVSDLQPTTPSEVAARFTDLSEQEATETFKELYEKNLIINERGRFYTSYEGEGIVISS